MTPSRRRALVLAVNLGSFITILDISIVNVALPTMQAALRIDMAGLQWVVDAYALFLSAFMLSAGPLGDRYGRKRSWLAGVLLFTVGSALCGLAGNLPMLLAGRAVQGVAGALLIPGALSLLTQAFPDARERAQAIGVWASCNAISLIVGPMLGGVLVAHFSWQSIFLINLPVGALAIALGLWSIQESRAALQPGPHAFAGQVCRAAAQPGQHAGQEGGVFLQDVVRSHVGGVMAALGDGELRARKARRDARHRNVALAAVHDDQVGPGRAQVRQALGAPVRIVVGDPFDL